VFNICLLCIVHKLYAIFFRSNKLRFVIPAARKRARPRVKSPIESSTTVSFWCSIHTSCLTPFQSYTRFSDFRLWWNVKFDCCGASETGSDVISWYNAGMVSYSCSRNIFRRSLSRNHLNSRVLSLKLLSSIRCCWLISLKNLLISQHDIVVMDPVFKTISNMAVDMGTFLFERNKNYTSSYEID
jgi:hypothetical protein